MHGVYMVKIKNPFDFSDDYDDSSDLVTYTYSQKNYVSLWIGLAFGVLLIVIAIAIYRVPN